MSEQIWTINAFIMGAFFLTQDEELRSGKPPHPLVRKFQVLPEFDEKNKQTGIFNIIINFAVDKADGDKPAAYIITDLAHDILDYYLNLLTFLSGSEVKTTKPIELKYEYPEGDRYRSIMYPSETVNLIPPVPLTHTYLFKTPLNQRLSRCLAFYSYGVKEKDLVTSVFFFLSALDMISAQFESNKKTIRKCENCSYEKEIEAGTATRIKYVFTEVAGFSEDEFKATWKIRNSIFHGYFTISSKNVRELLGKRKIARVALIRAIKKLIGLNEDNLPLENDPNWFVNPILDNEYVSNK